MATVLGDILLSTNRKAKSYPPSQHLSEQALLEESACFEPTLSFFGAVRALDKVKLANEPFLTDCS